jgi:hypothetical protein
MMRILTMAATIKTQTTCLRKIYMPARKTAAFVAQRNKKSRAKTRRMTDTEAILKRLDAIQADLAFVKSHLREGDTLLSSADLRALREAEQEFRTGKTVRLS